GEVGDERVGQLLCSTAWHHPANQMRHRTKYEAEAGRQRAIERQHAVRGDCAEQGARPFLDKEALRQSLRRTQGPETKCGERNGMTRPRDRTEGCTLESRPAANDAAEQP